MLSRNPIPNGIQKMIALGRYEEAATALTRLAAERPSLAVLVALASVNLQLGDLAAAKHQALRAVEAAPRDSEARAVLARIRAALDEREAALDDFRAVLELAPPPAEDPAGTPVHVALHNLEQLDYIERKQGLAVRHPAAHARRPSARTRGGTSTRSSTRPAPWCRA